MKLPSQISLLLAAATISAWAFAGGTFEGSPLHAQLTQFNGGCPPNQCEDVQFSVHRAPVCTSGPNAQFQAYSLSMVREFSGALAGGSSTLIRAQDGVAFDLSTTGLRPYAPYTVWYVAFNPDNPCIERGCDCGEFDLRPGLDGVFYAAGAMTDRLGSAHFIGNTNYGELPTGEDQIPPFGLDAPIQAGAEIHFVVRGHGRRLSPKNRD